MTDSARFLKVDDSSPRAHEGWEQLVTALNTSGVAPELTVRSIPGRVGPVRAARPPEPEALTDVLDGYFRGEGAPGLAVARARHSRFVSHRQSARASAREIVGRLRLATVELESLSLVDDEAKGHLVLRADGAKMPIAHGDLSTEWVSRDGEVFVRRNVSVEALVAALNTLLMIRGISRRFLPLATREDVVAYVGVEPAHAMILDSVDALDEPLEELLDLAAWSAEELVEVVDQVRSVA